MNLFVINGIAPDIPLRKIVWGVLPFLALLAIAIVLLLLPEVAVWLPNHCRGSSRRRDGGFPTPTRAQSARRDRR